MSRREKEALEAARKKEAYMKKHLAGETDQAKADLARLAEVRARRAEQERHRLADGRGVGMTAHGLDESSGDESDDSDDRKPKTVNAGASATAAPAMSEKQSKKRAEALATSDSATAKSDELPKLKSIDIKKMNGDALKENLKARGLKVQGQKKELMQRLIDYEASRS